MFTIRPPPTCAGCSACKPFRPVYANAAAALSRDGGCAVAAAVDCTRDFAVALACGVRSLPAVVAITSHGRRVIEYDGDRSADGLRRFVCRALRAASEDEATTLEAVHAVEVAGVEEAAAAATTATVRRGLGGTRTAAAVRGKKQAKKRRR